MAGGYDGEIRIKTKIDNGDVPSQLMQLEARMQKATKEATRLFDEMRRLEQTKIPTEEYKDVSDGLHRSTLELDKLLKRQEDMAAKGKASGAAWDELDRKIKEVSADIESAREYQRQMVKEGTAYVDPKSTAEYQKLSDKLRETNTQIDILKRKEEELATKQKKVGDGAKQIEKVGKAAQKTKSGVEKLTASFKRTIASFLMFSVIMRTFTAVSDAFKEGIQKMAQYSTSFNGKMSELKSATATLRASLGTLAEPIISAVVPALVTLINWITSAINKINELIAALSGKNTWTKAKRQQVDYAKSLDGTANAAKKAKGALQGFDELNVIQSQDTDGGGGSGGTNGANMYEEVPTSDTLISKLQPFLDYLKRIKAEVIRGWNETWDALDIDSQIADIKRSIESIRGSLADIFGNADLQAAADNFVMTLAYSIGQISASVVSVGATIAQNILGGIALYLEQNGGRITEYLIRMFNISADVAQLAGEAAQAFAYVFQAFGNEDGQQITANLIQIFTDIFGTLTLLAAQFGDDMLHFFIDPFVNNSEEIRTALEGILEVVADVTTTISEITQQTTDGIVMLYDEHIHPLIQSLTDGVDEIIAKLLEFWNTYMQPILKEWADMFEDTYQNHLKPVIDKVIECIGQIIDIIKILWEKWIQPLIVWIIKNILPVITPILSALGKLVKGCVDGIIDFVNGLLSAISDVLGVITKLLTGDWKGAWESAKKITKDVVNGILSATESMANGIVNAINTMIRALNGLHFSIPDWVPVLGGKSLGFNISEVASVSIPRLANGGITTGSTLVNIGEAGREAVLPLENNLSYLEPLAEMIAGKMEGVQTVRIVPEESGIFKVVRDEANSYYRRTGKPAFLL